MTKVTITFVLADARELKIETEPGASVLQLAHELGVEMEGACEGNMACSTCHVIVDEKHFEEMLDLAPGLSATSRLGCQVIVTEDMDGLVLHVPFEHRNMMGF